MITTLSFWFMSPCTEETLKFLPCIFSMSQSTLCLVLRKITACVIVSVSYKSQKNVQLSFLSTLILNCLIPSVQFSSVTRSCPTLFDPMNPSTPGLPIHHQLLEFTQTHVHRVSDAIQPSNPLLSPSPPALNPSQHQGLFQWVSSSHEVAKVLEFQLQHQSFQWTPRTDLL